MIPKRVRSRITAQPDFFFTITGTTSTPVAGSKNNNWAARPGRGFLYRHLLRGHGRGRRRHRRCHRLKKPQQPNVRSGLHDLQDAEGEVTAQVELNFGKNRDDFEEDARRGYSKASVEDTLIGAPWLGHFVE